MGQHVTPDGRHFLVVIPAGADGDLIDGSPATSVKQDTGNTSLASIDGKTATITGTVKQVNATAAGDNTIITPASGKKIRLKWIQYRNESAFLTATAKFKFAAGGTTFWDTYLSQLERVSANLYGANIQGAADEAFILNLSGAAAYAVNVTIVYEEVS